MDRDLRHELARAAAGVGVFALLIGALVLKRQMRSTPEEDLVATASATTAVRPAAPTEYLGDEIIPPRSAPDFRLIDRTGEPLGLSDLQDRVVLLGFAYTNCATICPMIFRSFLHVERELQSREIDDVVLAFITLDPDLDTPERLQEATEYVGGHWHFLTEEQEVLEKVWNAYRVFREKRKGVVDHSGLTYLIDRHGLMRVRYGGTPQTKVLMNDIEKLRAAP